MRYKEKSHAKNFAKGAQGESSWKGFVLRLCLGLICCFILLGETKSYHINSFSLTAVPYASSSQPVTGLSCSRGSNFDGGVVTNRGLFRSRYRRE